MSSTKERAELAARMHADRVPWETIAETFGWSVASAKSMASRARRWEYHHAMRKSYYKKTARPRKRSIPIDWHDALVGDLARLWEQTANTADQIARILSLQYGVQLSREAIVGKAHRLELEPRKPRNPKPRNDNDRNTDGERAAL